MNISKKWLADYVALNCDDAELCKKLTMAGIEVEKVEKHSPVPALVVAAKIESREPHPGSDHLSICRVFNGTETLQIVCGAPNCDAGKIVPLAQIGTVFQTAEGEFKIKKSKLRGVESSGMLCSGAELGVSDDNSGLLILDASVKPGTPVGELFGGDTFLELEVTPNRPDWLSIWGIARDVSCLFDTPAKLPELKLTQVNTPAPGLVTVEAPDLCPRYIGRLIRNVKIGPSPKWMVEKLESVGLRSINNVVDVTNFILMELGQPMHAFDLAKLEEQRVVVRRAKPGEKIVALNGRELTLSEENLVIADARKPMALAGIMGGEYSGVTETTTDVLLESAVFNATNIRFSSRRLAISSDSSYRFERGVDYEMADYASDRAAQLILELAGGELGSAKVDVHGAAPEMPVIACRFDRIRSLLGIDLDNDGIVEIFRRLHLGVSDVTGSGCQVKVPSFRLDLSREADLAEEVARINGLDKIPEIPVRGTVCHPVSEDACFEMSRLRDAVLSLGLDECIHYSIVDLKSALCDSRFSEADLIKLSNPLSVDNTVMRPSLLGVMLDALDRNVAHGNTDLALFELDKVFCANSKLFPEERDELCILLTGTVHPERYSAELKRCYDFYDLKGMLETLMELLGVANYRIVRPDGTDARFKSGNFARIDVNGRACGLFGEIDPKLVVGIRCNTPVFVAQLEVAPLLLSKAKKQCKALPVYPGAGRDIAFVAPAALTHAEITDFIKRCRIPNLESVRLFDIFEDDALKAKECRSMAYGLFFRNRERTLTDNEVNSATEKLRSRLAAELKVELR